MIFRGIRKMVSYFYFTYMGWVCINADDFWDMKFQWIGWFWTKRNDKRLGDPTIISKIKTVKFSNSSNQTRPGEYCRDDRKQRRIYVCIILVQNVWAQFKHASCMCMSLVSYRYTLFLSSIELFSRWLSTILLEKCTKLLT